MACEVLDLMNGQLVMNEIKLNFSSGYTAGYLFFQSMWEYLQDKMSDQDKDDFGMLMAGAYGVPGWDVDWKKAVVKFYGEQIDKSNAMGEFQRINRSNCKGSLPIDKLSQIHTV